MIAARGKPNLKLLHGEADGHPKLLHSKVSADTIRRPEGKGDECSRIMNESLVGGQCGFMGSGGDKPSFGPEFVRRRREVALVAMYRPKVDRGRGARWQVTDSWLVKGHSRCAEKRTIGLRVCPLYPNSFVDYH